MIKPNTIFQFSSEDFKGLIINDKELNLAPKLIQAFEYVLPRFASASPGPFSEDQEVECGRYMWSRYLIEDVDILIRRYRGHITLYARSKKDVFSIQEVPVYSAYTFDLKSIGDDFDDLTPKVFNYLNTVMVDLIQAIKKRVSHLKMLKIDVSAAFFFVEEKYSFTGFNKLVSIDDTLFACEELFTIYFDLILKHTRILDNFKVGQRIPFTAPVYKITAVYDDGVELLTLRNGTTGKVRLSTLLKYYLNELPPEWLESI